MKVDVEGYEPFVFRGLHRRIEQDRPIILTELSDKAREGFVDEAGLREVFYSDAQIVSVGGRSGRTFKLEPFSFARSYEILIVPPEHKEFISERMRS
jgi:hypothetical protein